MRIAARDRGRHSLFTIVRMRQRASLFAGLLIVAAIVTGVCAGVVSFLSSSATIGVRGVLDAAPGAGLSLGIAMPLAPDAAEQERLAKKALRATFHDGARSIPISIESSVESVLAVDGTGADTRRVGVATASNLHSDAEVVAGRWASEPAEATLQADAAAALGLVPGDTLSIAGTELTVVGTWRVSDAEAARWMADERWTTGSSGNTVGPLIVDASAWSALDAEPWVNWTIVPDVSRLRATDLAAIEQAWGEASDALTAAGLETGSRSGRFLAATREVSERLAVLETAIPVALVILAAIAALTIWELAGLTVRTRASETALLWSRGATTVALSAGAGAEAAVVTAIGSAVGLAIAATVQWSARGEDAAASAIDGGVWAGAATIAVGALAFSLRTVRTAGAARTADRAGRARGFAGVGGIVLLLIAAALSTWQLLTYGPITRSGFDGASVDPLTVVAPALVLAGVVLLGLYAFPLLATAAERTAVRTTGTALTVRGVSRRLGAAAVTIVMVGLAVGQLVLAAGYSATWAESFTQAQELRAGTVLRLKAPFTGIAEADLDRAATATNVDGLAPVRTMSVSIGGEQADLLGIAPAAIAALTADGSGLIDPVALADAVTPPAPLPPLPAGATTLTVDVGASPAVAQSVWIADAWGRLENLPLEPAPQRDGPATALLPVDGSPPWQLAAVDLTPTAAGAPSTIAVESITTDAGAVTPVPSVTAAFRDDGAPLSRSEVDDQGVPRQSGAILRLLPAAGTGLVVVSEWLARRIGAEPGSSLTMSLSPTTAPLQAVVAAIVPAVPGSVGSSAILVDASVIDAAVLRTAGTPHAPSTVWIGSSDPPASAQALRELLPSAVAVRELGAEPDGPMLAAGAAALWIAGAAGAALAIAGLIAVCAAQQRDRRHEVGVLRTLGLTARQQAKVRRGELGFVLLWGAVCGIAAGLVALLVVVATLARAAIPGAYPSIPTVPRFDLLAGIGALAALALAVAVVVAIAGTAAGRSARSLTLQEGEA